MRKCDHEGVSRSLANERGLALRAAKMTSRCKIKRRLLPLDMRDASSLALPCRSNFCGLRSAIFIIVILVIFAYRNFGGKV
jgi:protein subunit release factor A